jgi:hypothetical protein
MPAQVGDDAAMIPSQRLDRFVPETAGEGKAMEEHHGCPIAFHLEMESPATDAFRHVLDSLMSPSPGQGGAAQPACRVGSGLRSGFHSL